MLVTKPLWPFNLSIIICLGDFCTTAAVVMTHYLKPIQTKLWFQRFVRDNPNTCIQEASYTTKLEFPYSGCIAT